jgi:hypothetical protein
VFSFRDLPGSKLMPHQTIIRFEVFSPM